MTTAVTSPAGSGALASTHGRGLSGQRSTRWGVGAVAVAVAVVLGSLVGVSDLQGRAAIGATDASLASLAHELAAARTRLTGTEQRLTVAQGQRAEVTRTFDAAQAALSSTQATLARDQAGLVSQGLDRGQLDRCLSAVEEALNQISVGQTSGGLDSLRASSSSCSALDGAA